MLDDILNNHRGPYIFMVTRPFATKPGFHRSEWLRGDVEREDVGSEALALIDDPRDSISAVYVWSQREQAFVTAIRGPRDVFGTIVATKKPSRGTDGKQLGNSHHEAAAKTAPAKVADGGHHLRKHDKRALRPTWVR